MKKLLFSFLVLGALEAFSQSVSSDYFEVYTKLAHSRPGTGFSFTRDSLLKKISAIPDTANTYATFAISVSAVAEVDSLTFTLTNSLGTIIFSGGNSLTSLQSNPSFKINGNTLYYTVGPFPYLKRFSATARMRGTDGQQMPIQSFTKN